MEQVFTACRITNNNILFPDEIKIDDSGVTFRKGRIIGHTEIRVRYGSIGSVTLESHLLFADIIIETTGGRRIKACGFSRLDAEEIKEYLEQA